MRFLNRGFGSWGDSKWPSCEWHHVALVAYVIKLWGCGTTLLRVAQGREQRNLSPVPRRRVIYFADAMVALE